MPPKFVFDEFEKEPAMGISNFGLKIRPEVEFWPFLCKLGKRAEANLAKTWSICQNFTSKRKQVMYNFANSG